MGVIQGVYLMVKLFSHGRLISWIQNRCVVCERFLGGKERIYCETHYIEIQKMDTISRMRRYRKRIKVTI
jgi:hypothetical protein